jgi:hypothetical protein
MLKDHRKEVAIIDDRQRRFREECGGPPNHDGGGCRTPPCGPPVREGFPGSSE